MKLLPHQLEPVLAIVLGHGSRVLIADDVGLGKTVQAGLIVSELMAREAASRVLVLVPAGLRAQWIDECRDRFGLPLHVFDAASVNRHRRELPAGLNPWSTQPLVISSMDYVKRPEVLPAVRACRWDVVVVDEAHHAAAGSDRHDAVATICGRAAYVVLLTATPHNGDARAFASLCAIGQRGDRLLVFRRTRTEVGGRAERHVHRLRVGASEAERYMHRCLAAFVRAVGRERKSQGPRPGRMEPSVALAVATLRKRALSSAFALARSVDRRLGTLDGGSPPLFEQLALPLSGDDPDGDALGSADQAPAWTIPALADVGLERMLLSRLLESARLALSSESKLRALERLLRRLGEPALIFTEYRDTLLHVRDRVTPGAAIIHGGLSSDERRAALEQFRRGSVLLATDAAGEGLNLHHRCRVVINLELPWSPVRLEQRIGRVDRIGQERRVHVFHLIAAGTGEGGMLERLAGRVARARAEIGAADPLESGAEGGGHSDVGASDRLPGEAALEHARLSQARWLTTCAARCATARVDRALSGAAALVGRSTRGVVRARLRGRVLVVVRSELADRTGRVVASRLTPLLVPFEQGRRITLEDLITIESALAQGLGSCGPVDTADRHGHMDWLESSLKLYRAFWDTRVGRERALASTIDSHAGAPFQRGLFDHRVDRDLEIDRLRRLEARNDAARRIRAARQVARLEARPFRTALVLLPWS